MTDEQSPGAAHVVTGAGAGGGDGDPGTDLQPPPDGRHGPRQAEVPEPLAALTGSGSSVVGVQGAMRARDVSRPSAADLAAAATLPVRRATPRPGED